MAGPSSERSSTELRSALGAAISFEFECSYAAAEANKAACEMLSERGKQRSMLRQWEEDKHRYNKPDCPPYQQIHILGEEGSSLKTEVIFLEEHALTAEQPVKLALIQPKLTKTTAIVSRTKLLRRSVKSELKVDESGEPVLAAMFGDIALPLATFARRKDGQCSYVQIGSEIKDDNFHVMASDDRTGRNVVIEAIRDVLDEERVAEQIEPKRKQALQKLLDIEFRQNQEQLSAVFEAQLVRNCTKAASSGRGRRFIVLNGKEEGSTEQIFNRKQIIARTRFNDNRFVDLVIASPTEGPNEDVVQLLATTHGILGINVATLNSSTGQIQFENPAITPGSEQRKQIIYRFLSILRNEPFVNHGSKPLELSEQIGVVGLPKRARAVDRIYSLLHAEGLSRATEHRMLQQHQDSPTEKIIAQYFRERERRRQTKLFDENELSHISSPEHIDIDEEVRQKVADYLRDPLVNSNPYPTSMVLNVAVQRLAKENNLRAEILNKFNVQNIFSDIIGETTVDEELLVQRLYDMSLKSGVHRGVVVNERMNNTDADALIQVEIKRDGTLYSVIVSGKPFAMEDEPLKILPTFCFDYDVTKPIHAQLNGSRAHIKELTDKFSVLEPVK